MKLTRFQYKRLKLYQRYLSSNSYLTACLRTAWFPWLILLLIGLFGYFHIAPVAPAFGYFLVGLAVASFIRDLRYAGDAFRMWPVTRQILDSKKISELTEAHERNRT